jgi:ectoine hydroxylase-related dioxygenase (phytanoyl-CoA dioxygenase family)
MATNAALDALQAEAEAAAAAGPPAAGVAHRWPFGPHGDDWDSEQPDAAQAPDPRWCEWQRRQSEWAAQLPEGLVTVQYDPDDPHLEEKCLAAMGRDGAVVLANAVTPEICDTVVADMKPYIQSGSFLDGFYGKRSKRIGCLPSRSRASDPIVAHPTLMKLCDALLGRQVMRMDKDDVQALAETSADKQSGDNGAQQLPWTLDLTQIITLNPGSEAQVLHHDGGYCLWNWHDSFEHKISTVWALTDFDEAVGATRVVINSPTWPVGDYCSRSPVTQEDSVPAIMPKGSCVIYLSSCIHGSGPNLTADRERIGLNVDYNLARIRTEENQYLSNPPEAMVDAPVYMQRLCGYTKTGDLHRTFCDAQHPKDALALVSAGGLEGRHTVDWASSEPWGSRPWGGHTGVNAEILAGHLHDQPWRWSNGPNSEDEGVRPEMFFPCVLEPDPRWCEFQQELLSWLNALPPPPVRIDYDPDDSRLPERLIAALYRDGGVVLSSAVSAEVIARVVSDMQPYLDAAAARNGGGARVQANALVARSEASWEMVLHPAIEQACQAVIGRQVLDMSKSEMQKNMRYPGRSVPFALSAAWLEQQADEWEEEEQQQQQQPPLQRDADYLQLNLGRYQKPRVKRPLEFALSTVWGTPHPPAGDDHDGGGGNEQRFVPGSHRWPQHREPLESESLRFELACGDVAIFTGHTQHSHCGGGGRQGQTGLHIDFAAGFVAEREVQTLSNPPEIARHYPKALQRLVGYETHGEAVSYYGDWVHPIASFDLQPIKWATIEEEEGLVGQNGAKL